MDPDTFARERLGWWSPVTAEQLDYALNKAAWEQLRQRRDETRGQDRLRGKVCRRMVLPSVCVVQSSRRRDLPASR